MHGVPEIFVGNIISKCCGNSLFITNESKLAQRQIINLASRLEKWVGRVQISVGDTANLVRPDENSARP